MDRTVVDFDWPSTCPDEEVADLDTYFTGDISASDSDFHIDNADGADSSPPSGGCVLRTESESATIISIPGVQSGDLEYYPERGDEISFVHYFHRWSSIYGASDFEFRFGVQDSGNYYFVRLDADESPEIQLGKASGFSRTVLDTTDFDVDDGTFREMHISWGTETADGIEATFGGLRTVSASDDEFDEGGIGFQREGTVGTFRSYTNLLDTVDATVVSPDFAVDIVDYDGTVEPGETASVTASIENLGGLANSESIEFSVDGTLEDSTLVSLDGGYTDNWDSTTETFEFTPDESDSPGVDIEVCSADTGDCATRTIAVLDAGAFTVDIVDANQPVEGEAIEVTADVTNTGEVSDSQTVEMTVPDLGSDSTTVSLSAGSTTTETFTVATQETDAGHHTATVETDDDFDSTTVQVVAAGAFEIDIFGTNSPVTAGSSVDVDIEVANTGATSTTETLELSAPDLGSDSRSVTLDGYDSTLETLSLPTSVDDRGDHTVTVSGESQVVETEISVRAEAEFEVEILFANDPVEGQDDLEVIAEVVNTGDTADSQLIDLVVPDLGSSVTSVSLAGGERAEHTFTIATNLGQAGEYTATISGEDDTDSRTVTVRQDAFFEVDIVSAPSPVYAGDDIAVTAEVTNTGDVDAEQDIVIDVPILGSNAEALALENGQTETVDLSVPTSAGDAAEYPVTVESDDTDDTTAVEVLEQAEFTVEILDSTDVVAGETVVVNASFENIGDVEDTRSVTADLEGLGTTETDITLSPGQRDSEEFTFPTNEGDAGDYTATVSTDLESATTNVTVFEPAFFDVEILEVVDPIPGDPAEVSVEITNTGGVIGNQTIGLDAGDLGSDETTVELGDGHATTETLSVATTVDDLGNYTVTVTSENTSDSAPLTITGESDFVVEISSTNLPVSGENLNVTVTVTNDGTLPDNQTISLDVEQFGSETWTQQLDVGESVTETFSYPTAVEDEGTVNVTLTSEDDSDEDTVSIVQAAIFAVEIVDITDTIAGDEKVVTANVTNTGDEDDIKQVELDVPGLGTDSAFVSLGSGVTDQAILSVPTTSDDIGSYVATVSSDEHEDSADATVYGQPNFEVDIVDAQDTVAGEDLEVTVDVTNTGEGPDTQTVELDGDELGNQSTAVTLGIGETTTETLTIGTDDGDRGAYTLNVSSENDETSTTVTVLDPPSFELTVEQFPGDVVAGEDITVTVDVGNVGDIAGTETVEFTVFDIDGDTRSDSRDVSLEGGENSTEEFAVPTSEDEYGGTGGGIVVTDSGDSENMQITLLEPASFDIVAVDAADVVEGSVIDVDVHVTNSGEATATKTVDLDIDPLGSDDQPLTLDGDESANVTLSVPTLPGEAGNYTAAVTTPDDQGTTDVSVFEPPYIAVNILSTAEPVEGENLTATVELTNTGGITATQAIEFDATIGTVTANVTLDPEETTTRTLAIPTAEGDAGQYGAFVASENETETTSVTVLQDTNFVVDITDVTEPAAGEDLSVTATIENTGAFEGTQDVTFDAGDLGSSATEVTLDAENQTVESATFTTDGDDAGVHTITVSSEDDTDSTTAAVFAPSSFVATVDSVNEPTQGADLAVTVTVTNEGDVADTHTVQLVNDDLGLDSTAVSLAAGNSTTETLSLPTGAGDFGIFDLDVVIDGDTDQSVTTEIYLPAITDEGPPQDLTGDGLYEDVRGTGEYNIFDVQTLFANLDHPVVTDNPRAFSFQGDHTDTVGIFDVQTLFDLDLEAE